MSDGGACTGYMIGAADRSISAVSAVWGHSTSNQWRVGKGTSLSVGCACGGSSVCHYYLCRYTLDSEVGVQMHRPQSGSQIDAVV